MVQTPNLGQNHGGVAQPGLCTNTHKLHPPDSPDQYHYFRGKELVVYVPSSVACLGSTANAMDDGGRF